MFRIALCDDCSVERGQILTLLDRYSDIRPGLGLCSRGFASGFELLSALETDRGYDLYLLDILMPDLNGIELARNLRERKSDAPIIFLTSSPDYSLDAFEVWAVQYLMKPVTGNILYPIMDRLFELILKDREKDKKEEPFFVISTPANLVNIPVDSIIHVENLRRVPHFFLVDGDAISGKCIRGSFTAYLEPLLKDSRFICPHASYVINLEHVNELTKNSFFMQNGIHIPIPRYKYTEMKSLYFSYLSKLGLMGG